MISTSVNGKVLDWHYKKYGDNGYSFYIGNTNVGIVFDMGRSGWDCVNSYGSGTSTYKLSFIARGFKTRYNACKYLIDLNDITGERERDNKLWEESEKRAEKI